MPTITYCLSTSEHPIDDKHPLWSCPMPADRQSTAFKANAAGIESVSYSQYFSAVHRFCAVDGWARLADACSEKLQRSVTPNDISGPCIYLVKHGAFYHPSQLRLTVGDVPLSFVINVALSEQGRQALPREIRALNHLADKRPFGWYPKVYHATAENPPMFLADWFDGFHEFHLTRQTKTDELAIVVWDGANTPFLLSENQAMALYRKAAMILGASYDPITSCQVYPWHHAAGDFVVRKDGDDVAVKLITVRDYAPLSGSAAEPASEREILETLMVFLLHLSVRMRLDRLDGVSAVVWAPESCLAPMIAGFFQGLDLTARISGFPEGFSDMVHLYFSRFAPKDLLTMAHRLIGSVFDQRSEERRIVERHLNAHVGAISRLLAF